MRRFALATVILTFVVVVVGAYVRLSDAGLGCPDWPLCYGRPVPDAHEDARAWKEMGHRYLAGTLGLSVGDSFLVTPIELTPADPRARRRFGERNGPSTQVTIVGLYSVTDPDDLYWGAQAGPPMRDVASLPIVKDLENEYRQLALKEYVAQFDITDKAYINGEAMEKLFAPYR